MNRSWSVRAVTPPQFEVVLAEVLGKYKGVRVRLLKRDGKWYVDTRVLWKDEGGNWHYAKKGITLHRDLWETVGTALQKAAEVANHVDGANAQPVQTVPVTEGEATVSS